MTSAWRKLGAFAVLALLALQMGLPAAHASAHASFSAAAGSPVQELQPAAAQHDASDPAACPICQSLHARVAVLTPAPTTACASVPAAVAVAPPLPIPASVVHSAHAPRAPPSEALSLA
jgi:hypothetical protein